MEKRRDPIFNTAFLTALYTAFATPNKQIGTKHQRHTMNHVRVKNPSKIKALSNKKVAQITLDNLL